MNRNQIPMYVVGGALVAALLTTAGVPLIALLPFAIVLICPLMMFVMMRGMQGSGGGNEHACKGSEGDHQSDGANR